MARADRVLFLVLAGTAGVYAILRAFWVPVVHDECASLLWFVRSGDWLPYHAHWDANNHYLGSGIGILITRIFGESLFALRAGCVLAFVLYAWAAWRVGAQVRHMPVRACLWAALLWCPFLLDFFSLFRGYGIELAGWLFALDGLMRYATSFSWRHMVQTLVGLLLASSAIVALLPAWALVLAALAVLLWHGRGRMPRKVALALIGAWLLFGALPFAGLTIVALELKERGLLYHGSTDGFFSVTLTSLCRYVLGSPSSLVAGTVVVVLLVSGIAAVRWAARPRTFSTPLALVALLLWSDVLLRWLMALALGVNYPEDRAALHFVPLALLSVALAVDRWAEVWPRTAWGAVVLLVLPARSLWTANLDHTLAWPEQSVPERFMARAEELGKTSPRALLIGGQHQLALAWPMGAWLQGRRILPLQTEGFPEGPHDLRIVDARFLPEASVGYHVMDSAAGPGLWLLERDDPLRVSAGLVLRAPERSTREEFAELAQVPDSLLRTGSVLVEVSVPLIIPSASPDVRLVLEVNDAEQGKLFYDAVAPLALRPDHVGQRMNWAWGLPQLPAARRAIIYLYNPGKVVVSHGMARTVVSGIRQ